MWKHNGRVIRIGRGWMSDDGFKHPSNWNVWSSDEKAAFGVVWEDDPVVTSKVVDLDAQKAKSISDTKRTAANLLSQTDWQVIKATEVSDYTVPSDVTTYRAAVRTASNTIEAAITGAADLDAFMALYDTPVDENDISTGNAPINDWPKSV